MFIKPKHFPWILFNTDDDDGGGSDNSGVSSNDGNDSTEELGFPKDTPVDEMTPEQQLAYWKNDSEKWRTLSRKHEKNRKPKDFDRTLADAQKWREKQDENLEPDEKAVKQAREEARKEGKSEAVTELLPTMIRAEFKSRVPHMSLEQIDAFVAAMNMDTFYVDGEVVLDSLDEMTAGLTPPPSDDDDDDDKSPKFTLGGVLANTRTPKKGRGPSLDEIREQTRAKYKTTDK